MGRREYPRNTEKYKLFVAWLETVDSAVRKSNEVKISEGSGVSFQRLGAESTERLWKLR
jgi:hypothetical protein